MKEEVFNINKTLIIFKKELRFFFYSPVAYLFTCLFLLAIGAYFFTRFFIVNQVEMRLFFEFLPIALAFVIPGITMNLFSEEFQSGSYEIINTTAVNTLDIVLGKFLAALAFMSATLLVTIVYPISISFLGELDWGPVIGGYIGGILLIAMLSAIGVFASSLTSYSFIALLIGWMISLTLGLVVFLFLVPFSPPVLATVLEYISANYHFNSIARGVIDFRSVLYFLSITAAAIYATKLVLDMKK